MKVHPEMLMKTKQWENGYHVPGDRCRKESPKFGARSPNSPALGVSILSPDACLLTSNSQQAADKPVRALILSSSEGSVFEFSSNHRFFAACWLLRMAAFMSFAASW
jgi:hypothetical protein